MRSTLLFAKLWISAGMDYNKAKYYKENANQLVMQMEQDIIGEDTNTFCFYFFFYEGNTDFFYYVLYY